MVSVCKTVHRGAFCQFPFQWIYYCHISKSTGKETGKTHLCALVGFHLTLAPVGTPDLISCLKKTKLYTGLSRFSHAHNFCSEIRQKDKGHRKQDTFLSYWKIENTCKTNTANINNSRAFFSSKKLLDSIDLLIGS